MEFVEPSPQHYTVGADDGRRMCSVAHSNRHEAQMPKRTGAMSTMPEQESQNIEGTKCRNEIRSIVRCVSGRATGGVTPRGSSGQPHQRKNTTNTLGFRDLLRCDQDLLSSANGAAFGRWLEERLLRRNLRCLFADIAMVQPLFEGTICRVPNGKLSKPVRRSGCDLFGRDVCVLFPSASILQLFQHAGTRFHVPSGILPGRVRGGDL